MRDSSGSALTAVITTLTDNSGEVPPPTDPLVIRILEAASDAVAKIGWTRLTMRDVAARAGVGRATLYRHFAGKEHVRDAIVVREFGEFMREMGERRHPDMSAEEAMLASTSFLLDFVRTNPILTRLREIDRETLLRITNDPEIIAAGATLSAAQWQTQLYGEQPISDAVALKLRTAGEITTRLSLSLMTSPDTAADLSTPETTREFIRSFILPILPTPSTATPATPSNHKTSQ
ncbi:TetR/AcrR family transcriptional regulator [Gordonia sp. N1V]|uniref:TetR/AcrR family transcriptional regulator n=1 Tax=Gordonia sp. N1V TaxID=3034163 RepID=UPI0023E2676C|nr:TetR/AcrR family transcriptional regulator [Gordonia sp. N1V]MDF3283903.1 TetR/AcrR family transcriptional regulator [Gordonia sp. N1V]